MLFGITTRKESCVAGTILEPGQIEAAASKPPFTNLPPRDLFALRSERLAKLAEDHPLADYLRLLAGVCRTAAGAGQPACQRTARPCAHPRMLQARHAAAGRRHPGARRGVAAAARCLAGCLRGAGQPVGHRCHRPAAPRRQRPTQGLGRGAGQWPVRQPAASAGALSRRRAAAGLDPLAAPARPLRPARTRRPDALPLLRRTAHGRGDSPPRAAQRPALPGLLPVRLRMALRAPEMQPLPQHQEARLPALRRLAQRHQGRGLPRMQRLPQAALSRIGTGRRKPVRRPATLDLDLLLADQGYNRQAPNLLLAPGNEA